MCDHGPDWEGLPECDVLLMCFRPDESWRWKCHEDCRDDVAQGDGIRKHFEIPYWDEQDAVRMRAWEGLCDGREDDVDEEPERGCDCEGDILEDEANYADTAKIVNRV